MAETPDRDTCTCKCTSVFPPGVNKRGGGGSGGLVYYVSREMDLKFLLIALHNFIHMMDKS